MITATLSATILYVIWFQVFMEQDTDSLILYFGLMKYKLVFVRPLILSLNQKSR